MIKHLNIRAKTIKHSEENRVVNVNVGLGNDFLDMIQKAQEVKEIKIGNLESSKLKLVSFKRYYQECEISRAPAECWQGALKPRRTRGTPEQPCMMCGWRESGEELWRLVGVRVLEGQLGEDRFSYTCRVGMGRDPWVWKCSLGLFAIRLLPPLLYTGNHRYISVPILVPFPGIH